MDSGRVGCLAIYGVYSTGDSRVSHVAGFRLLLEILCGLVCLLELSFYPFR